MFIYIYTEREREREREREADADEIWPPSMIEAYEYGREETLQIPIKKCTGDEAWHVLHSADLSFGSPWV